MLEFTAPIWLSVPAAVGALGVWALWRGQRRLRAVSSVRLWRGLEGAGSQGRRRVVDPLWVMVLAAGILAGLGLAGPRWVHGGPPVPQLAVEWSVRSLPSGGMTEAWVRWPEAAGDAELALNGITRPARAAELRQGLALGVAPDAAGRVRLELRAAGGRAAASFERAADLPAFGLIEDAGPGLAIDPALRRVFAMQRGARPGDPSVRPRVLLVNNPQVTAEDLAGADLVVGAGGAMPGVTLGEPVEAGAGGSGWVPEVAGGAVGDSSFAWPGFVVLKNVHVNIVRAATLSPDWHVIATAGGRPWIAWRAVRDAAGAQAAWIWLASAPGTETDWPRARDAGFVVFFAEMQQRALGPAGAGVTQWLETQEPPPRAPAVVRLNWPAGLAGLALLAGAMIWFVGRGK